MRATIMYRAGDVRVENVPDRIQPGRVFDRVVGIDEVPDGYRAMDKREAIKVMVKL